MRVSAVQLLAGVSIAASLAACAGPNASGTASSGPTLGSFPVNGVATMQSVAVGQLQGPVGGDGTLTIQSGPAYLRGQFTGDRFDGTYTYQNCTFALAYKK